MAAAADTFWLKGRKPGEQVSVDVTVSDGKYSATANAMVPGTFRIVDFDTDGDKVMDSVDNCETVVNADEGHGRRQAGRRLRLRRRQRRDPGRP